MMCLLGKLLVASILGFAFLEVKSQSISTVGSNQSPGQQTFSLSSLGQKISVWSGSTGTQVNFKEKKAWDLIEPSMQQLPHKKLQCALS